MTVTLDPIALALTELGAGRPVIVIDDENRENEGDFVLAADLATPSAIAFMVRHSTGIICVAMDEVRCQALGLPPMVVTNEDPKGTAYTVSVDAAAGVTTGVSASDRAQTARVLAAPTTRPSDLRRPGHMFPLRARPAGSLMRPGHTEATVDLCRLAGRQPVGLLVEIVREEDGEMMRTPELVAFARKHGLAIVSIADLIAYRLHFGRNAQSNRGSGVAVVG